MKIKKSLKNEYGAISFEFLGILPFYFLLFLMLWQIVASGYALLTSKTAANEAAKVFALEQNFEKAKETAEEIIGSSSILTLNNISIVRADGDFTKPIEKEFEVQLELSHELIFVPDGWKDDTAIDFKEKTISRVMK